MQMNYKEKKTFHVFWSAVDFYVLYGDRGNYHSGTQGCSRKKKMTVTYTKSLMYVWKVLCWSVCWGLERSIVLRVM